MGRRKSHREKNLTDDYKGGAWDDDRIDPGERFSPRSKHKEQVRIERTAKNREEAGTDIDIQSLPVGRVTQVFSLYIEVMVESSRYLCTKKKTLTRLSDSQIVVGDEVRFRTSGEINPNTGQMDATIELVLPRRTVLARSDSFKAIKVHPLVANADQMLIVASIRQPDIRWGLIDRMVVAGRSGSLLPIVVLNKIDLCSPDEIAQARGILDHYEKLGIKTLMTSVEQLIGISELRELMKDKVTILAGHSGVGKSSLIAAIQPGLDIRVGEISAYHEKGKHTTTSARDYQLQMGGRVIDTPGIKMFGLWNVDEENLLEYFPDIEDDSAPEWRKESYERILQSMGRRR